MNIKRVFFLVFTVFVMAGCGNKESTRGVIEDKDNNKEAGLQSGDKQTSVEDDEDTLSSASDFISEMTVNKIPEENLVFVKNVLDDGTIWGYQSDSDRNLSYIHFNIKGEIIDEMEYIGNSREEFASETMDIGLNNNLFINHGSSNGRSTCSIYNIKTKEDVTDDYLSESQYISDTFDTEIGAVVAVYETIDTFNEKYATIKLLNQDLEEIFSISLDADTLIQQYGIEKTYDQSRLSSHWPTIKYAGGDTFYIEEIDSSHEGDNNSLLIDLGEGNINPIDLPDDGYYSYSDGNQTLFGSEYLFRNQDGIKEEKFLEYLNEISYTKMLNDGTLVVTNSMIYMPTTAFLYNFTNDYYLDLNNMSQEVYDVLGIDDLGYAYILFSNGYITVVDKDGTFMFDPIKCQSTLGDSKFYSKAQMALIEIEENGENVCYSIDRYGNLTRLNINLDGFGTRCEEVQGKKYWLSSGLNGYGFKAVEVADIELTETDAPSDDALGLRNIVVSSKYTKIQKENDTFILILNYDADLSGVSLNYEIEDPSVIKVEETEGYISISGISAGKTKLSITGEGCKKTVIDVEVE